MATEKKVPELRLRIVAAVLSGIISASLILALFLFVFGLEPDLSLIGFAFGIGLLLGILHGVRSKRASVASGILGFLYLLLEGMALAIAAIFQSVVFMITTVLSVFSF